MNLLKTAAALLLIASPAWAGDPRCDTPPYGGTVGEYKAFVKNFGSLVMPAKFLGGLCNMKFGNADRTGLYNMGFTDSDIDSKATADLGVDLIMAINHQANHGK
jgi:hypothetical protein